MQDLNNVYDNMYNPNGFDPTVWFFRSAAPTPATSTAPAVINNGAYQWINTSTGATNMPAGTITRFFPVMQGFFVRKINAVPKAFVFRNSHRETTYPTSPKLTPFYRSSTPAALAAPAAVQLGLTLTDATTEVADLAFVGFRAGANAGTDILWDVVRPGDNTEAPTLFTRNAANDDCAYNALPLPAATTITLPLAAHTLRAGQPYRLTVSENTLPAGMRVYLEDRQNGKTRELTTRSAFTFTAEANASDHRFFLRFEPAGAAVSAPAPNVEVYPNPTTRNSALVISANKLGGTTATATLLNAFGQTVAVREVPVREGLLDAALATTGLPAGVYVLRVATATGVSSQRVEIR